MQLAKISILEKAGPHAWNQLQVSLSNLTENIIFIYETSKHTHIKKNYQTVI